MVITIINTLIITSLLSQISKEDELIISLNKKQLNLYDENYFKDIVLTFNSKKIKFIDLNESEKDFFKLSCHRKLELKYKSHYDQWSSSKDEAIKKASIRLHQDRTLLALKHTQFAENVFKKHNKVIPQSIIKYYMTSLKEFHISEKIIE